MPLHAITSVHGEAGLRERLAMEISGLSSAGRDPVEEALRLVTGPPRPGPRIPVPSGVTGREAAATGSQPRIAQRAPLRCAIPVRGLGMISRILTGHMAIARSSKAFRSLW